MATTDKDRRTKDGKNLDHPHSPGSVERLPAMATTDEDRRTKDDKTSDHPHSPGSGFCEAPFMVILLIISPVLGFVFDSALILIRSGAICSYEKLGDKIDEFPGRATTPKILLRICFQYTNLWGDLQL